MPLSPRYPVVVTVRTPGPPTSDPRTGNEVPGVVEETTTPAYLSQEPVSTLSAAIEIRGYQATVRSNYTLLVPAGVNLHADSQVIDPAGVVYRVNGAVAQRRGLTLASRFQAASVQVVSDLEGI